MKQSRLLEQIREALAELRLERELERKAKSGPVRDAALVRRVAVEDRMYELLRQLDRGNGIARLAELVRLAERAA